MYYRLLIILLTLSSSSLLMAVDPDKKDLGCGEYMAYGKVLCQSSLECSIVINPDKLSKLVLKLEQKDFSVSYFTNQFVKMKLNISSKKKPVRAKIVSAPIKQLKSVKTSTLELKKVGLCL